MIGPWNREDQDNLGKRKVEEVLDKKKLEKGKNLILCNQFMVV